VYPFLRLPRLSSEETTFITEGEKTMFKRNEGMLDRIGRVVLGMGLVPAGLFWLGGLQGSVIGLVASGLGVMGLITGFTGVCEVPARFPPTTPRH
jgi:hypothetical protein